MALLVPSAAQCLAFGGPIVSLAGLFWFWRHGDEWIARLFPHLQWKRELGWLNLSADRRADRIMRGLTHALHVGLLAALIGILGFAWLLGQPHDTDSTLGLFSIPFQFIYLPLFLGIWIVYFTYLLGPRVRAEFEEGELRRYREENPDEEPKGKSADRLKITVWNSSRPRRF